MKKLLKIGILIFGVSLLLTNCQETEVEHSNAVAPEAPPFKISKINSKTIQQNSKLIKSIESIKSENSKNKKSNQQNKEVYSSEYDFTIETDYATYVENEDGSYHSYTFPIYRISGNENLENLLLSLQPDGSYKSFIVSYDITEQEQSDLDNGIEVNMENKVTFTEINGENLISNIFSKATICGVILDFECWTTACEIDGCWDSQYTGTECGTVVSYGDCGSGDGGTETGNTGDGGDTNGNTGTGGNGNTGGTGTPNHDDVTSPTTDPSSPEYLREKNFIRNQLNAEQKTWFNSQSDDIQDLITNYLENEYQNDDSLPDDYPQEFVDFISSLINLYIDNPNLNPTLIYDWFLDTPDYTEIDLNINPDNITYDMPLTQQTLPSLDTFVDNFPKFGGAGNYSQMPTSQVYSLVGGSLLTSHQNNPSAYSNACSIRGSRGLLYSGIDIPVLNYPGVGQRTQKGGDNENYILDAVSFDKFMRDKFGAATHELTGVNANDPVQVANLLNGKNGIYVIINNNGGPSGAGYSGHVDAIINGDCISSAYTTPQGGVKSIRIWILN